MKQNSMDALPIAKALGCRMKLWRKKMRLMPTVR